MSPRPPRNGDDEDEAEHYTPTPQFIENDKSVANARERLAALEAKVETRPTNEQMRREITGTRKSIEAEVVKKAELVLAVQQALVTEIDGLATGEHVDNLEKNFAEKIQLLDKKVDENKPPGFWAMVGGIGGSALVVIGTVVAIVNSVNSRAGDLETKIVKLEAEVAQLVKDRDRIDGAQVALLNLITTVAAKIK